MCIRDSCRAVRAASARGARFGSVGRPGRFRDLVRLLRVAGAGFRAPAGHRHARGLLPRAQPRRVGGVDDRAPDEQRAHGTVPAVRLAVHAGVAAPAGHEGRPPRRGVHGGRAAEDDPSGRRRVPGRRHDGRDLRARRRLPAHRHRSRGQAGVPGQLGHDRAGPQRPQGRARRCAVRGSEARQGRFVVPGHASDEAAACRRGVGPVAHLQSAQAPDVGTGAGRALPVRPGDAQRRAGRARAVRVEGVRALVVRRRAAGRRCRGLSGGRHRQVGARGPLQGA